MKYSLILTLLLLTSCVTTQTIPTVQPTITSSENGIGVYQQTNPILRDCSCGYIINKGDDAWGRHWVSVQNQCSGNVRMFAFDRKTWETFKISSIICMKQNSSW